MPTEFRQTCSVAVYTGLRPGELRALTWGDVDLEARTLSVSKAIDGKGESKPPKTVQGQRVIPILAELVPMLEAMKGEPGELVVPLAGSDDHSAQSFRRYLSRAVVK